MGKLIVFSLFMVACNVTALPPQEGESTDPCVITCKEALDGGLIIPTQKIPCKGTCNYNACVDATDVNPFICGPNGQK